MSFPAAATDLVDPSATTVAELAGGFVHELKNHVSTLNLNLQLLAEDFADPRDARERRAKTRIDRLRNECQRMVDVSNDFLRFARAQEVDRKPVPIDDVVWEMIDFVGPTARQAGINVNFYPKAKNLQVPLDRELFKQVLLNLLINAEQAMPEGGEIVVQSRVEGSDVFVEVIDTGTGIPPEVMPKIFKPFHTTKPGGTGLGLPTCRKIVRAHGGDIDVQSQPGQGTKFTLRIPLLHP
jgi:two-component system, NtrC family, sensor histidine kinase HydH